MPTFEEELVGGHMLIVIPPHHWRDLDRDDLPTTTKRAVKKAKEKWKWQATDYYDVQISNEDGEIPF